jgi:hypothetical protein
MATPNQAAERFCATSASWKNGGPTITLVNDSKTARVATENVSRTNWKQLRADCILKKSEDGQAANFFEFTVQMDSLRHNEIVMGVVDPKTAPTTPSCLHSCQPSDGVWIYFFGFDEVQEGDFLTALVDFNAMTLTFARNGTELKTIAPMKIPEEVVPVIELYGYDRPIVSLIKAPFLLLEENI